MRLTCADPVVTLVMRKVGDQRSKLRPEEVGASGPTELKMGQAPEQGHHVVELEDGPRRNDRVKWTALVTMV